MEFFSYKEIILLIFGGGGAIIGIVQLMTLSFNRVDRWREKKRDELKIDISETIDFEKLKNETLWKQIEYSEGNFKKIIDVLHFEIERLAQGMTDCKKEGERLEEEIEKLRESNRKLKIEVEKLKG